MIFTHQICKTIESALHTLAMLKTRENITKDELMALEELIKLNNSISESLIKLLFTNQHQ
jgi:hypothetical protein